MAREEETVTTFTCDLCNEEIEGYSKTYNAVFAKDICDKCRGRAYELQKDLNGE